MLSKNHQNDTLSLVDISVLSAERYHFIQRPAKEIGTHFVSLVDPDHKTGKEQSHAGAFSPSIGQFTLVLGKSFKVTIPKQKKRFQTLKVSLSVGYIQNIH